MTWAASVAIWSCTFNTAYLAVCVAFSMRMSKVGGIPMKHYRAFDNVRGFFQIMRDVCAVLALVFFITGV